MVGGQKALADLHGLLVLGDEVMVTFRQRFFETLVEHFGGDQGFHLEETAEDNHVEQLGDTQFAGLVGSGHLIDVDALTIISE